MTNFFPLGVICLLLFTDGLDQRSCKGNHVFFWLVLEGIIWAVFLIKRKFKTVLTINSATFSHSVVRPRKGDY